MCTFERDDALSTSRLSQTYCTTHSLPRIHSNWQLVHVVASSKPGTGALLLLAALIHAARAKKTGVISIAVTRAGRRLFQSFGFDTAHGWRERPRMTRAHAPLAWRHGNIAHAPPAQGRTLTPPKHEPGTHTSPTHGLGRRRFAHAWTHSTHGHPHPPPVHELGTHTPIRPRVGLACTWRSAHAGASCTWRSAHA